MRSPPPREVEVQAAFGVMHCFEDDLITEQLRTFGGHTRPELAFLSSVIAAGDTVFDIGAHIGTYAIPLGQRVAPDGLVVAVEADAQSLRLLSKNIAANHLGAIVTPVNALVAPVGASYTPNHDAHNTGATRFVKARAWRRTSWAPVLSIDALAREYRPPQAVKIDIEGMELTVLEASRLVAETRPILYTEVSAVQLCRYGRGVREFSAFLRDLDYRLFRNVGERNGPHDHFIAAELEDLELVDAALFDVLAVPADSPRLGRVTAG